MSYRPYMIGAMAFATFIMVASMVAYADSPRLKGPNDAAQKKGAAQLAGETKEIKFKGICDGSAAVKLGGNKILVAYDEKNTLFAFDINGGMPTARIDLAKLNLKIPEPKGEIDIEAAAVAGKDIWWIGSHSRSKEGGKKPNRRMLFATNVPSPDLGDMKVVAQPLDLTDVLLNAAEVGKMLKDAEARKLGPKEGGISIEGLATSAGGGLLVGFRSPLSGEKGMSGKAIVVKLLPKDGKFEVEKAILLDLGDRGIRDIINSGAGYMIIAGPPGEEKKKFALYTWDGVAPPQQTMSLEGLNAEAIVDLSDHWLILSDDGKKEREYEEAKDDKKTQTCDEIRKDKSKGEAHPSVYFRAKMIPK